MKFLIIALLALQVKACTKAPESLENTSWKVLSYETEKGEQVSENISCVLFFIEGRAKAKLDVNQCSGSYVIKDSESIEISESFACTRVCCDEPQSTQALNLIGKCNKYKVQGNTLLLYNAEGVEVVMEAAQTMD